MTTVYLLTIESEWKKLPHGRRKVMATLKQRESELLKNKRLKDF